MILDLHRAVSPPERVVASSAQERRVEGALWSYAILRGFLSARCDRLSAEACCIASLYCKVRRRPQGRHGWASGVQSYRERGALPRPLSFACPPASDSGIRGYTGRARALLPSSLGPGRAPAACRATAFRVRRVRPSPASLQSLIFRGVRGASPRLNLTLLQHRFPPRKRKIKGF